jgi:hypothetical protein
MALICHQQAKISARAKGLESGIRVRYRNLWASQTLLMEDMDDIPVLRQNRRFSNPEPFDMLSREAPR